MCDTFEGVIFPDGVNQLQARSRNDRSWNEKSGKIVRMRLNLTSEQVGSAFRLNGSAQLALRLMVFVAITSKIKGIPFGMKASKSFTCTNQY
jgi:hypothetical protein